MVGHRAVGLRGSTVSNTTDNIDEVWIVQSVSRRAGRPGFDSRQGQEFYFLQSVQIGSGVHPASYPIDAGGSFPGGKAAET
jgi:hypothetical protein